MKTMIVSYSLTGNNAALASSLAKALEADHAAITEPKPRTMGTIALDMLFHRIPRVDVPVGIGACDLVLFVAPVWMGQAASPLRECFRKLGPGINSYAFVSISGGADGPNPRLAGELRKRLGKAPAAVVDLHIADLLPREPKPQRKDTSAYRVTERDVGSLTGKVLAALAEAGVGKR